MITSKKAMNWVGGKLPPARACDSCMGKRARWYCTADDAFLCQGCDSSVHSVNPLASRHERVRLEIRPRGALQLRPPAWHRGFTRKARTPRGHTKPQPPPKKEKEKDMISQKFTNSPPLVPEINGSSEEEIDDQQLLYRVPVFQPFAEKGEFNNVLLDNSTGDVNEDLNNLDINLHGFLPTSEMDYADFATDVESLLGTGLDFDSCGIEELGLLDCKEEDAMYTCLDGRDNVKVEDDDDNEEAIIDWNFDCDQSPVTGEEEEEEGKADVETENSTMTMKVVDSGCKHVQEEEEAKRNILLRLNHEAVITAWASQRCPWTTGIRPQLNPDDHHCWPDFMGWCGTIYSNQCGGSPGSTTTQLARSGGDDAGGGREARVSRYREKRMTRLFSKKIRYEVRKLNAEKRPRMKGRFVKRALFNNAGLAFPSYRVKK